MIQSTQNSFEVARSDGITAGTRRPRGSSSCIKVDTEVVLQPAPAGLRSSYRKVRGRASWDFALAGLALVLRFDGDTVIAGRIVLSGAAPVPWRTRETARVLVGTKLDSAAIARAAEVVMGGAEPLEHNG